jgi:hypothetical protein
MISKKITRTYFIPSGSGSFTIDNRRYDVVSKRLKQLEDENAKLKKLLAEQMLDAAALRELLSKKW